MRLVALLLVGCAGAGDPPADLLPSGDSGEDEVSDDTEPPACLDEPAPRLVLGTGDLEVTPLVEGQDLRVVHGIQGGLHIPLALAFEGVPNPVTQRITVTDPETGASLLRDPEILQTRPVRGWSPASCAGDFPALWGYTDVVGFDEVGREPGDPCPTAIDQPWVPYCGRVARIVGEVSAEVEGELRLLATASVDVLLQPDPADACRCPGPG